MKLVFFENDMKIKYILQKKKFLKFTACTDLEVY